MLTITITGNIETNEGIARNTGKPYCIKFQRGYVDMPNGERRNVELQHEDNARDSDALAQGVYRPKASAFYVDQRRKVQVSMRARAWEPVEQAKPAKAA